VNKLLLMTVASLGFYSLTLAPVAKANNGQSVITDMQLKIKLDEPAIELRTRLNMYKQFSANFSQQVIDSKGKDIQQATGLMKMSQPNQFRWVTNEPDESVVVSDGNSVWIYNPFVEQVTAMSLDNTMTQSPLWLIANQSDEAWSSFSVEKNKNNYIVRPKDSQNLTRKITMNFNGDVINQLVIEDAQGQTSSFTFTEFDYLTPIDNSNFKFVLPEGVDFDDQREIK